MIASIVALCNRRQIIYTTETTSDYYFTKVSDVSVFVPRLGALTRPLCSA